MTDADIFHLAETHGWLDDFGRWNFKDDGLLRFVAEIQKAEREEIIKWLVDEGFFVKDGPLTEAIRARSEKLPVKTYCGGKPNYCTPEVTPEVTTEVAGDVGACVTCGAPKGEWLVDAVNISQERVDETAKCEHVQMPKPVGEVYGWHGSGKGHPMCRFDTTEAEMPVGTKLYTAPPKGEHEPVAWLWKNTDGSQVITDDPDYADGTWIPLYTAPPVSDYHEGWEEGFKAAKREWVGLTDDEVFEFADTNLYEGGKNYGILSFGKAIEAKLKEKNT